MSLKTFDVKASQDVLITQPTQEKFEGKTG